jgi:hypothetical protein
MGINMPTFSILRPSKIYPNWDFWFENIASGNPADGEKEREYKMSPQAGSSKKHNSQ